MDIRPRSLSPPARHKNADKATIVQAKVDLLRKGRVLTSLEPGNSQNGRPKVDRLRTRHKASKPSVAAGDTARIYRVECIVYSGQSPISERSTIEQDEISGWLRKPVPNLFQGKPPVAGLRLLCCRQQVSMVKPFEEKTFRDINDVLGLPESYSYLTTFNAGACGKYKRTDGQPIFIYHRSNNNGTISSVLHWSPTTNLTLGYLLLGPRISLHKVTADLVGQFPHFSHPLFVPTYLGECTAADLMCELHHIHSLLARAERRTRFGDWEVQDTGSEVACSDAGEYEDDVDDNETKATSMMANTVAVDTHDSADEEDEVIATSTRTESRYWAKMWAAMDACGPDYQVLSQILGALSCRFAFMDVAVGCGIVGAEFTQREMERMREYCGGSSQLRQLKGVANSECLDHRIELLISNLKHIKVFGAIAQRMQAQQNVLFNLIAQEDNTLNRGIAEDSKQLAEASKRDSSAMKIIAFLTTVFLPGTFVATFFAMPLFDWGAYSMTDVTSDHFWIYWTVTAPLTLLVMGVVGTYAWIQTRRNRLAADKARKKAGTKEA